MWLQGIAGLASAIDMEGYGSTEALAIKSVPITMGDHQ